MLPLRSVGRSNFVRVCVNLATLIKKRHILMRTAVLYVYIYMYIIYTYKYIYAFEFASIDLWLVRFILTKGTGVPENYVF